MTLAEHPEMTEPLRETLHGADQNRQQAGAPPIRRVMAARYCLSQTTERELTPSKTAEDKLNRIPLRKFPVRDADLSARAQGIERVITRERRKLLAIIHHSLYIHVKWLDRNMHRLERVINHLVRRLKFRSVRSRLARPLVRLVISEKPPPVRKYVAKQSRIRIIRSRVRASKRAKAKEGARDKLMDEIIAWLRTP